MAICAVNIFALVSGYLHNSKKGNAIKQIIGLWFTALFYSVIMCLTNAIVYSNFSGKEFIRALFPLFEDQFWYFTAYFMVLVLYPVYSLIDKHADKNIYRNMLIVIGVLFTIVSMIFEPFDVSYGYSWLWLAYLYAVGLYIKKYGNFAPRKRIFLPTYFLATIGIILFKWLAFAFGAESTITARLFKTAYNYNCIFVFIQGISMLCLFSNIKIRKCRIIELVSKHTFGIYLAQSPVLIVLSAICRSTQIPTMNFLVCFTMTVMCFLLSLFIDMARSLLFRLLRISALSEQVTHKINKFIGAKYLRCD